MSDFKGEKIIRERESEVAGSPAKKQPSWRAATFPPRDVPERLQESAPDDTYGEWGLDEDLGEEEGRS